MARTLGDDLRDFKAGKIKDKYHINNPNKYYYKDSGIDYSTVDNNDDFFNPARTARDTSNSNIVTVPTRRQYAQQNPITTKDDPVTVQTRAQYEQQYAKRLFDVQNVYTVPKKSQFTQYHSDVESLKNVEREKKYADYTYSQLRDATSKTTDIYEQKWLEDRAIEIATSQDLQNEFDELDKELGTLTLFNEKDDMRRREIEERQTELETSIKKKQYEEIKKANYTDALQNDVKAWTTLQQYYYLKTVEEKENQIAKETGMTLEEMINSVTDTGTVNGRVSFYNEFITQNDINAYNYVSNLSEEEKKSVISRFEKLNNKDELYKFYSREQEEKATVDENQLLKDYAKENKVAGSLASVGLNTVGAVGDAVKYIGAGIDSAMGGDGYIDPNSTNVSKAQTVRETVSKDMSGLGQFLYNTGMSMADFISLLPLNIVPGGQVASLAIMSTSAGVSSANQVIENGGDINHAIRTGFCAGLAEVFFEKFSLDALIELKRSGKTAIVEALIKNGLIEGSEEGFTEISNALTDYLINDDLSQYGKLYNSYLAMGYNDADAWKMCAGEFGMQFGLSVAGGALSGGVLGSGTATINVIGSKLETKSSSELGKFLLESNNFDLDYLIQSAKDLGENSKASKLAKDMEKKKKNNPVDVGNLWKLTTMEKEIRENKETQPYSETLKKIAPLNQVATVTNTATTQTNVPDTTIPNTETVDTNTPAVNVQQSNISKTKIQQESVALPENELYPFGKKYIRGLSAKTLKGQDLNIVSVESSAKNFGEADNTVILRTSDGQLVNADEVIPHNTDFQQLLNYAKNFDSNGAKRLLSQYESYAENAKENGRTPDVAEYAKVFEELYNIGKIGVEYESVVKSGNYSKAIDTLGVGIARTAVTVGNADINTIRMNEANKLQRVRIPGENNIINSKVKVEFGSEKDAANITDEQKQLLQAVAIKAGKDIVLTNRLGDNENGKFQDGKIYISTNLNEAYILPVALHEATHGIRIDNPLEYQGLCEFITNYLVENGENIDYLLNDIKIKWEDRTSTREDLLEELVCQTVMAIATDEVATRKAIECNENKSILEKALNALKSIIKRINAFIRGFTTNIQAQAVMNDVQKLRQLADKLSTSLDNTKALNAQSQTTESTEQKNNTNTENNSEKTKLSVDDTIRADPQTGNKVKSKSAVDDTIDLEYMIAVNKGDMETAQRLVDEVAKANGYNSPILYHGTKSFGFTEFDLSKMDDGRSIFLTDSKRIASTYSGVEDTRKISENYDFDIDNMSPKNVVSKLNLLMDKLHKGDSEYAKYQYIDTETVDKLSDTISKDIDYLKDVVSKKKIEYKNDGKIYSQLSQLYSKLESRQYTNLSTSIYMLLHHTDVFKNENKNKIADIEKNIRLFKKVELIDVSDGVILKDMLDGYSLDILYNTHAKEELEALTLQGNYSMYGNLDGVLIIDAKGAYWNNIKNWISNVRLDYNNTEVARENDDFFYLIDKRIGEAIPESWLDVNEHTKKMSKNELQSIMLNKANNILHIRTENVRTTRDIAKFAQDHGYSGVVFNNLADNGGQNTKIDNDELSNIYIFFSSSQIKSADPVTYDDNGNVIPLSERFKDDNKDIRYSVDDTIDLEYMTAVNKGDMETAQRLVDEAAERAFAESKIRDEDGKLLKVYHGTDADFTVFDKTKGRTNMDIQGMFFSPWEIDAKGYGPNVRAFYLNITNPANESTGYKALHMFVRQNKAGVKAREHLVSLGYDGVNNEDEEFIAFNSNQIKSADPVTYDDDGNVIPLSERFKDDNKDIRYSVDDTIIDKYTNIDLSTLDANEIKVYNNRGWSYSLFNNEDLKLLNEKFSELDSKYRTDNVLGDGSRVVEINNKLVLIGGTFKEPMVHGVLTVNSDNETEADYFKERLIYETKINKWDRYQFNDYCLSFESIVGKELVRYYDSADFSYRKGQRDTRERALLPNSFKNYGYTKQFQNGRGDSSETEQGISAVQISNESDIKYAIDDTITDGFFSDDGDLFTDDGDIRDDILENAIQLDPSNTVSKLYNHSAKSVEIRLQEHKDIELDDKAYLKIAHKLMNDYKISRKENPDFDVELAEKIKNLSKRIENGKHSNFLSVFDEVLEECKGALLRSNELDNTYMQEEREQIFDYLKGKTLLVTEYAESDVRENYGSVRNYKNRIFGKVNVALERNSKAKITLYMDDIISFVEENFPYLITDEADSVQGFKWLDNLINGVLQPRYENHYLDGYYENIDTATIEMAFAMMENVIDSKARQAILDKKLEKRKVREVTKARKQAIAEREALKNAKIADYSNRYQKEQERHLEYIRQLKIKASKNDNNRLRYEAQIEHLKNMLDAKTIILDMGYNSIRKEYWDKRYKSQAISSFNYTLKKLQKKYINPTKRSHIPSELSDKLLDVMEIFVDVKSPKSVHKLQNAINELKEAYENNTVKNNPTEYFQKEYYKSQADNAYSANRTKVQVPETIRENILSNILHLKKFVNDNKITRLYECNTSEIDTILDLFKFIEGSINDENKLMLKGKEYEAYEISRKVVKEFENVKGSNLLSKAVTQRTAKDRVALKAKEIKQMFENEMNDPVRFAKRMVNWQENSVFVDLFEELSRSERRGQSLKMQWTNKAESVFEKYSSKELNDYKRKEWTLLKGVPMTRDMAVEFVLECEDEYGFEHLANIGYTKVPDIRYLKKKNQNKAYDTNRAGEIKFYDKKDLRAEYTKIRRLIAEDSLSWDIYMLCRTLYNTDMQEEVNKVTLQKYGYEIARVKNYCPISVDNNELENAFADVLINRSINSRSFLHQRTDGKNGLVLMGALDKLGKHIDGVSSWCGLTIAVEGFSKMYNMTSYTTDIKTSDGDVVDTNPQHKAGTVYFPSVKKIISQVWGDQADKYISKLMGDIQGANKIEVTSLDIATSNYIKATLTMNFSSAIKQLSSYPLAVSVVGWKPVIKGIFHIRPGKHIPIINKFLPDSYKHNVPMEEIAKYSPILWYRQQGNNSRDIYEINRYKRLGDPENILKKIGEKLHLDLSLNWLEKVDNIMVNMNYWICYEHVKNQLKIDPNSKEFMPKVVETLEEIIDNMMPNHSIMQQGQVIRNKNWATKIFTICKSQVFAMGNATMDVLGEHHAKSVAVKNAENALEKAKENEVEDKRKELDKAKEVLKQSNKKTSRTISALFVSALIQSAILKPFISLLLSKLDSYKDDDEQITGMSVVERFLKDFGSEISGCFLFGEQIYGVILSCFDSEEIRYSWNLPGLELLNDIIDNIVDLATMEDKGRYLKNLVINIGLGFGQPTSNANKIAQAIYNHIQNSVFYNFTPAVNNYGEVTTQRYTSTCYNALINGDKDLFETYKNRWLSETTESGEKIDEDYINNKLQDELQDDVNIIAGAEALQSGNLEKYESVVKKYIDLGFTEKSVTSAIDSIIKEQEKEIDVDSDTGNENNKEVEPSLYSYQDLFDALVDGNIENSDRIYDYLINECGKEDKDIRSALRSASRTDPLWKEYIEVSAGNNSARTSELKDILTRIYGSWGTATTYLHKYQKRMKEKEEKNN